MKDIIDASEAVLHSAASGQMSLQNANAMIALLKRHAELKGFEDIAELRAHQEELKASFATGKHQSRKHYLDWCRSLLNE